MIHTETHVGVYCDSDLKRLKLIPSPRCHGGTGNYNTQGEALTAAAREGFKPHLDGKHHLCAPCALLNLESVKK